MNEYLRLARLYMIVLAIFTVGRLATGFRGVPYEKGHAFFSLVTMTFLACAFYGAFCRKWLGYSVTRAMGLGATIGLIGQVVILTMTVLSYALHIDTYFSHPRALNATGAGPLRHGGGGPRRRPGRQRRDVRDRGRHRLGDGGDPAPAEQARPEVKVAPGVRAH